MSLLSRLAVLFVLVPIVELLLLIRIGDWIGLWPTLALVVVTGVTGAALARAEGMRVLFAFQRELAQGRLPGRALQDAIAVLIGGAFLLTPGILTDLTGFALLFPPTRRWIQARVRASLERRIRAGTVHFTVVGQGGLGMPFGGRQGGGGPGGGGPPGGLDPDKEIRVPPVEDERDG
jgi:UPF0716 protein FxsA